MVAAAILGLLALAPMVKLASGAGGHDYAMALKKSILYFEAQRSGDQDTPHRWHDVARYMGGTKSADEVRRHFERLVADVDHIESGRYRG